MENYLKLFKNEEEYSEFLENIEYEDIPNKSHIIDEVILNKKPPHYLTFIPSSNATFKFKGTASNTVSCSIDNGVTWMELTNNASSPTVMAGNKIMWRGNCEPTTGGVGVFSASTYFDVLSII